MKLNVDDKVLFAKLDENAVIPSKREDDAGYDLYACFEQDYIIIEPHTTKLIDTKIASVFSNNLVAVIKGRSSVGSKGLDVLAGIIDSNYRGEWKIALTNTNSHHVVIIKSHINQKVFKQNYLPHQEVVFYPYFKAVTQVLFLPVPKLEVEEITVDELNKHTSDRGNGGFGSTGK